MRKFGEDFKDCSMENLIQKMIDENANIAKFIDLWESFEANKIVNEELNNYLQTYINSNNAYSIENIFKIVKMDNHACGVHFIPTSKSYEKYGQFVTIIDFVCSDEDGGQYLCNWHSSNPTYGTFKAIKLHEYGKEDYDKEIEISTNDIYGIESVE